MIQWIISLLLRNFLPFLRNWWIKGSNWVRSLVSFLAIRRRVFNLTLLWVDCFVFLWFVLLKHGFSLSVIIELLCLTYTLISWGKRIHAWFAWINVHCSWSRTHDWFLKWIWLLIGSLIQTSSFFLSFYKINNIHDEVFLELSIHILSKIYLRILLQKEVKLLWDLILINFVIRVHLLQNLVKFIWNWALIDGASRSSSLWRFK